MQNSGFGGCPSLLAEEVNTHHFIQGVRAHRGRKWTYKICLDCSFSVSEANRNVPGNTRHVPPKTPFLKFLFRTPDYIYIVVSHIYIYIYMAVTWIGGHKNGQTLKNIPSFTVKNGQQKPQPPQNRGGFFALLVLLS